MIVYGAAQLALSHSTGRFVGHLENIATRKEIGLAFSYIYIKSASASSEADSRLQRPPHGYAVAPLVEATSKLTKQPPSNLAFDTRMSQSSLSQSLRRHPSTSQQSPSNGINGRDHKAQDLNSSLLNTTRSKRMDPVQPRPWLGKEARKPSTSAQISSDDLDQKLT